jgi:iron-sulfur cluster assembly protein
MDDASLAPDKSSSALSQAELDALTDKLVEQLKTVFDPEIPVDIYELGLIYKVDVSDDKDVVIDMTLTAPGCPVAGEMPGSTRRNSNSTCSDPIYLTMETAVQPRARRPRPKVVTLTDRAADRVKEIMARAEQPYVGLRVGVKNGGCAGQEYVLEYAEAAAPLDEVVEDKGVTILVDPKAVLFLIGTQVDYEVNRLAAKFTFNNPNQTDACGCGESVTIEPAKALD